MPYSINITIRGSKDPKKIADYIAQLIENATGQKVNIYLHDRNVLNQRKTEELQTINRKLLK
jgi:hypothetical protein